jgi:hypothetical protein
VTAQDRRQIAAASVDVLVECLHGGLAQGLGDEQGMTAGQGGGKPEPQNNGLGSLTLSRLSTRR